MRLIDIEVIKMQLQLQLLLSPNNSEIEKVIKQLISAIENAPAVDAVAQGQWIRLKNENGKLFPWYQCSKCASSPAEYGDELPPYCHCCGAKMAKVEL